MLRYHYILLIAGISLVGSVKAQDTHSLTELDETIRQFVDDNLQTHFDADSEVQAQIGHLDPRLRLQQCEAPLKTEIESGHLNQQSFTVKVSCPEPTKWSLRVPVKLQHFKMVAVATTPLSKGQVLSDSDVNMVKQNVTQITDGYFSSPDKIIGLEVQRNISAGNIIKRNMLKEPTVIHKGEIVKMVLEAPGFSIEGSGVAQNDGAKGQTIRVRNSRSNKIVEAVVVEAGVTTIPM